MPRLATHGNNAVGTLNAVARRARPLLLRALLPALVGAHGCGVVAEPLHDNAEPLPVEEAFVFTSWLRGERLVAHWDLPKGYYLYRHRFAVSAGEGVTLGAPAIPPGEVKMDDHFGESQVHYGSVEITVPVIERPAVVTARVRFQGCADSGLCYPVQVRTVAHEASARRASATGERAAASGGAKPVRRVAGSARPRAVAEDAAEG